TRTLYRESMRITRATLREAEASITAIRRPTSGPLARLHTRLQQTVGLVRRVLAQTRARVLQGDTHYPHKVLSLVELHTEAIRKGQAAKQTEFGKMVKIQEAEAQFITDYTVCAARVPDGDLWMPSLQRHEQLFGHAPRLAVADGSFSSRANEEAAYACGVRRVALPRGRGQAPPRWFQRAARALRHPQHLVGPRAPRSPRDSVTPMLRGGDEEKWRTNTAVGNCPRDWVASPLPISHREVFRQEAGLCSTATTD